MLCLSGRIVSLHSEGNVTNQYGASHRVGPEKVFCEGSYVSGIGIHVWGIRVCALCEFVHFSHEYLLSG